jgi:hypothetical protein
MPPRCNGYAQRGAGKSANPNAEMLAEAQIVTAKAKVLPTEIAIAVTIKLSELAGTRSTLRSTVSIAIGSVGRFRRSASARR